MVESAHYYPHIIITPEAVYRGGCGESPLSLVHIRITEVGMMNISGSEVAEEEELIHTHTVSQ